MALLGCYLDDSRDSQEQEIFAVAGFYGWSLGFIDAEHKWQKCLDKHGLKYFHAVECENVQGEFHKLCRDSRYSSLSERKAAAAKIRDEFISILNSANQIDGIGLAVPLAAYRKVLETEPKARILMQDRHFYFAYHLLILELIKRCEHIFKGHWIAFVCDGHSQYKQAEAAFDELKEKNPRSAKMLASLTHDDDKCVLPLQMADLLAYEARRSTLEHMNTGKVSAGAVINKLSESIWFFGYTHEEYLRDAIRDLAEQEKERSENQSI